ncbi:MAG TPA: hypothetical protein VN767_21940, partial [Streptosporangiaceae bacterium]|nr:hypothetical protein [Streptosporangiaceae bacterium]
MAGLPSVHGISGYQFFGWPDADVPTETAHLTREPGLFGQCFRRDRSGSGHRPVQAEPVLTFYHDPGVLWIACR